MNNLLRSNLDRSFRVPLNGQSIIFISLHFRILVVHVELKNHMYPRVELNAQQFAGSGRGGLSEIL